MFSVICQYGNTLSLSLSLPQQIKSKTWRVYVPDPQLRYRPKNKSDVPCYYRHHTAERTALHTVQYKYVYMAEVCYTDDCMEVSCTADDMVVDIADARRTRDKAASRRHMDYCKACCTVCVHNATGSGLYMVDMTRHTSPAPTSITIKHQIICSVPIRHSEGPPQR